jgi:oligopeptidase B
MNSNTATAADHHADPHAAPLAAPVAALRPHIVEAPFGQRNDPYYWLRDDSRTDPAVLAHLEAENRWYESYTARYAGLREQLFAEIKGRIKQDDASVPYRSHGYWYRTRFEEGLEYPIYVRRPATPAVDERLVAPNGPDATTASASGEIPGAAEELILNVNTMAAGHDYFHAFPSAYSRSQKLLAYAEDNTGRRQYRLRIRDLTSGVEYPEVICGCNGQSVFADDEKTLFYVENDAESLRSFRVRRHRLGSDPASDAIVYEEHDTSFFTSVGKTGSDQYIVIHVSSTVSDEERVLRADTPEGSFELIAPRQRDFLYDADHIEGRWVVRTDWEAPNFRLMQVAENALGDRNGWQDLVAHSKQVFINGFALFEQYFVVDERSEGLRRLRVQAWRGGQPQGSPSYVRSDEPAYTMALGANPEQDSVVLRYTYSSLTTPTSTYDLNMQTGERELKKQQPVLGGFDASHYRTERVWITSRDAVKVPVSIVYHTGTRRDGTAPLLQYGYGAYGLSMDPNFTASVISLLDRGFVYAIAHIRGGEEMGRAWYEDGKKLKKQNSFSDFIDVSEALVSLGFGARDKIFAEGGSAGGLLMGAIVNARPDLYRGILADVPFVDVVTTMLDESIPLTTNEFDEWGNPQDQAYYEYMLSYSPYDNVAAKAYPAMMVTTGLHDSQVQYFEPAKWVAKLRATKTDAQPLIFKINMEAGHGGKSGRFRQLEETAQQFAFLIDLAASTPKASR